MSIPIDAANQSLLRELFRRKQTILQQVQGIDHQVNLVCSTLINALGDEGVEYELAPDLRELQPKEPKDDAE